MVRHSICSIWGGGEGIKLLLGLQASSARPVGRRSGERQWPVKVWGPITKCENSRENLAVFRVGLREIHAGAL